VARRRHAQAEPRRGRRALRAPRTAGLFELRLDAPVGALVLAVTAAVLLLFIQGPHPFDPATYFQAGMEFPGGGLNLFTLRIGLVIPVWLGVLAFGPSEAALYAVPIASGLLLAGAVYATMVVLFRDRLLAAGAALVTVLNAAYLLNSSSIFPDTTATATFAAGFFFLVLGAQADVAPRWAAGAAAAAGVFFGWTYLIREFSPILLPAVVAAVLLLRYPLRRTLLFGAAAVATAALELAYAAARTGNPFLHASRLLDREGGGAGEGRVEHIQSQLDNLLGTLAVFPRLLLSWWSGWLLLFLVVLLVLGLVLTRDRRLCIFAIWLFGYWLVMALLGLVSLPSGAWALNITNVRYWYPVFPAIAMGAFGGLALLGERFGPARWGAALVPLTVAGLTLLILIPGIGEFRSCQGDAAWRTEPRERWADLRSWLATPTADGYTELWTDWRAHRLVPAFASTTFGRELWNGRVSYVERLEGDPVPPASRTDAVILVHREYTGKSLAALRESWAPVFATDDGVMVVLAFGGDAGHSVDWWRPLARAADRAEPGSCGVSPYEAR
jgi:hypothetical protein